MENEKKGLKKLNRRKKKISSFFGNIFQKFFSFESGIDISNDTQVLFRRNKVIKNIILVTNLLYTIILFIVSHGDSKNIVLSALLLPFFLLMKGAAVELPAGFQINVYPAGDYNF